MIAQLRPSQQLKISPQIHASLHSQQAAAIKNTIVCNTGENKKKIK
jgi:hypothetical protein